LGEHFVAETLLPFAEALNFYFGMRISNLQ